MSFSALVLSVALATPVSLETHGTLREALQEIAEEGGLSLIATGPLDVPAEVRLKDVPAEDALRTVAQAHDLEVTVNGTLWVVKPKVAGAIVPHAPPVLPLPTPPVAPVAPIPPAHVDANAAHSKEAVNLAGAMTVKSGQKVETAVSYGGPLTIEGGAEILEDAVAFGGDVVLKPGAVVRGDAVSFGGKVIAEEGSKLSGSEVSLGVAGLGSIATHAVRASAQNGASPEVKSESAIAGFLAQFVTLFGLGFMLMMFAPGRMKSIESELMKAPVQSGVVGLLALVASLPLTIFLVVTLIGIPVAVALWLLAGVSVLVGMVAVANVVGAKVPFARLRKTQAVVLAVGLLVYLIASRLPVVGPLVICLSLFISLGAIVRTRMGQRGQGLPVPDAMVDAQPVG